MSSNQVETSAEEMHKRRSNLKKVAVAWAEYAASNNHPTKGKAAEKMAHAFVAGFYVAGGIHDGAMFLYNVRGMPLLAEWAEWED